MSTAPLTPAEPPAVPPQGPPPAAPQGPAPRRWQPSRGGLIAALVVAVVLLVGSMGAAAAWVHSEARASVGISRQGGRIFVFPGSPNGQAGPRQQYQMPMNPGKNHMGPGRVKPSQTPTATPSPSAS